MFLVVLHCPHILTYVHLPAKLDFRMCSLISLMQTALDFLTFNPVSRKLVLMNVLNSSMWLLNEKLVCDCIVICTENLVSALYCAKILQTYDCRLSDSDPSPLYR
jgi:hypothetical protein